MRTVVIGTAGHIDHGKSALVQALTGTDPDRLKEEKARGITIELGFAHAPLADDVVGSFVDVPGHERFVRAMLAGVGGIDLVMLVVAADESVMPQTREHFDICRLLGVSRGLVVLTKADLVDPEMLDLVTDEVRDLVSGSFLDGAPIVPVSALTGAGLDRLRQELVRLAGNTSTRRPDGLVRLPIDRVFTLRGFGTVVTGTLVAGRIAVGDDLIVAPGERAVTVRGLHVHGGPRPSATAGERVAVNLPGVEVGDVARGSVLTSAGSLPETRRADVHLTLLPGASLKHGARVRVHQGTAEWLARVSLSGTTATIEPGGEGDARLRFEGPAVVTRGDRFILRAYSPLATIGGGVVLDPLPPRAGVRTTRGVARMAALSLASDAAADRRSAARVMIEASGSHGLALGELAQRIASRRDDIRALTASLAASRDIVVAGDWAMTRSALTPLVTALVAGLAAYHAAHPLAAGMSREDARGRWFRHVPPAIVDHAIAELVREGRLVATETLALPTHRVALTGEETAVRDWLDGRFKSAGLLPPDVTALSGEARQPAAVVDRVLGVMLKTRQLVKVDTLVFHADALARLKQEITARKAAAGDGRATVDVKTFKDAYNVSRKYAIPLLEYLDRERITRRMGDVRVVL